MAQFNRIHCHRAKPPFSLSADTGKLSLTEGEITVTEWLLFRDKVEKTLRRYNLLPKVVDNTKLVVQGNNFLYSNGKEIFETQRGKLVKAPFWLRWFCDKVVTKEQLKEYD